MSARVYLLEAKYELLKMARLPGFIVPTIGFPLMFYVLFGLVMRGRGPDAASISAYLIGTYGAFGVIGISLFALGVGVATERGQGWLAVKRASPMPVSAYFMGKYAMTIVFAAVLTALLALLGVTLGHVRLTPQHWTLLTLALMFGGLPFCAMGLAIGYMAGPNSASAMVQAIYLPMSFLSGLFIPITMLPDALKKAAVIFPAHHLGQLALKAAGAIPGDAWINVATLLGFGVLFSGIAVWAYKRDEGKTYG